MTQLHLTIDEAEAATTHLDLPLKRDEVQHVNAPDDECRTRF